MSSFSFFVISGWGTDFDYCDEWFAFKTDWDHSAIFDKYYLAIKKNEIIPSAAIWMDLETVILREVR